MIIPLVYRVYKATVQRVTVSIKNLNSNATFLVVIEEERRIILWVGAQCEDEDVELANTIADTIMKRDFRETEEEPIPTIIEGEESTDLLETFLDLMWSSSNQYFSKMTAGERKKALVNSSVSVGYIEPIYRVADTFDFQETAFAHPDSKGTVPRVTFVPIEMKTVAYVNVGDHWDIWCARAVTDAEIEKVMVFVRNSVATQLNLADNAATRQANILGQYVRLVRQGEESTLFRRPLKIFTDFEPPGKCAPRPDPAPRIKKEIDRKTEKIFHKQAAAEAAAAEAHAEAAKESKVADEEAGDTFGVRDGSSKSGKATSALDMLQGKPPAISVGQEREQRDSTVDFWSVPPLPPDAPQQYRADDLAYPPISMTVIIKDKDGVYGIDPAAIDADMIRVVEGANDNPAKRAEVIDTAARNPRSLIGYQVEIDDGVYAGVFVVAQVKKTLLHKTLFHLCATDGDRFWVRLRRNKKGGVPFRPLRRVVKVDFVEPAKKLASPTPSAKGKAGEPMPSAPPGPVSMDLSGSDLGEEGGSSDRGAAAAEADQYAMVLNDYTGADE